MIVLFLAVSVYAQPHACTSADVGKPCSCSTTPTTVCNYGFFGLSGSVVDTNGFCQLGGPGGGGTCGAPAVCCTSCGDGTNGGLTSGSGEVCDGGASMTDCCADTCTFVADGTGCTNTADDGQNDNSQCNPADSCNAGACLTNLKVAGAACNDGNACTDVDQCDTNGGCVPGSPIPGCGGGAGDPHIFGPFGERYMFNGQAGGIYSFFATKHFAVNVQTDHLVSNQNQLFMVNVGLVFGNVTLKLMLYERWYADKVNAALQSVGGRLDHGDHNALYMDLCPGHRVVVKKTWGVVRRDFHLDVTIDVPGCHDEYRGLVGQLYQCKYMKTKFHWDSTTEESFRVPTLSYVDAQFDPREPCFDQAEFGKLEKH